MRTLHAGRRALRSWIRALEAYFSFLGEHSSRFADLKGASFAVWCRCARADPTAFRLAVAAALAVPSANSKAVWARSPSMQLDHRAVSCPSCAMQLADHQRLAVHRYRVHGAVSEVRCMIETTWCPVCLLQMWTRTRLVEHLRKSQSCACNLQMRALRLPLWRAEELDEEARVLDRQTKRSGLRRGVALLPCEHLLGPRWPDVPVADSDARRRGQRRHAA